MALGPRRHPAAKPFATECATKNPIVTASAPAIMPGSQGSSVRAMPAAMKRIPAARTGPRPNRSARAPAIEDATTPNRNTAKTRLIWSWSRP